MCAVIIFRCAAKSYNILEQCFSTGVPRHTSVPWASSKCAAKFLGSYFYCSFVEIGEILFDFCKKNPLFLGIFQKFLDECGAKLFFDV